MSTLSIRSHVSIRSHAALIAASLAVLFAVLSTATAYAQDAVSTTDTTTTGTTTTTTPTTTSPTTTSPTTTSPTTTSPTTTSPTTTSPTADVPSAAGEYVESVPTSSGSRPTSSGSRNSSTGVGSSVTTLKDVAPSLDTTTPKHASKTRTHKRRPSVFGHLGQREAAVPAPSAEPPPALSAPVSSQSAEGVPVLWLFIALFAITGLSLGVFGYQRTRRAGF